MESITTVADQMLEYVQNKKAATFNELSKFLHLDENEVEKIARILEESGLVDIDYPFIGSPKVVFKKKLEKKVEQEKIKVKKEKERIVSKAKQIKEQAADISKRISLLEKIAQDLELADSLFLKLDELSIEAKGIKKEVSLHLNKEKKKEMDAKMKEFKESTNNILTSLKELQKSLKEFDKERKVIDNAAKALAKNIKILEKRLNVINKKVS